MRLCSCSARQAKRIVFTLVIFVCVAASMGIRRSGGGKSQSQHSHSVFRHCNKTLYPALCVSTLLSYPGVQRANPKNFAHITLSMSLNRVQEASTRTFKAAPKKMDSAEGTAFEDCAHLFEDAVDHINRSMAEMGGLDVNPSKAQVANVKTWLSAALTDVETCLDGFREVTGTVNGNVLGNCQSLGKFLSIALATIQIFFPDDDRFHIPRPLLYNPYQGHGYGFPPWWMYPRDRGLLQVPNAALPVNATVAQDGSGQYKTIAQAVMNAPSYSTERYVIHVKAGVYGENVDLPKHKTNVMLVGDGRGQTIVASRRSVMDGSTTFRSATFAASGKGFIARDMTFANIAGPDKHQAVALRVGADMSAFYRCNFIGFQNTLYAHSLRQFYRDCNIYGTVDFILGNAAAIFQNCNIVVRRPMANQTNTITAQGRSDPFQNTGISIQNCTIVASRDLAPVISSFPTYLGRPWKLFSRTVIIQSFLGDVIQPAGWLEWWQDFGPESVTVYYGEYMNTGPGSKVDGRVRWGGYRVITTMEEAIFFTVDNFISGSAWLPSSGIPFRRDLIT